MVLVLFGCGSSSNGGLMFLSAPKPTPTPTFPPGDTLAFIPNISEDIISVVAIPSNTLLQTLNFAYDSNAAATSPNTPYALFSSLDGPLLEIDTRSGVLTGLVPECVPWGVAIDPSGSTAYVAQQGCASMVVLSIPSLNQLANVTLPGVGGAIGVAVNPVMPLVYVADGVFDIHLDVVSTTTYAVVATIKMPGDWSPYGVAVSNDGASIYVAASGGLVFIHANGNQVYASIPFAYGVQAVAMSADGSRVYVTDPISHVYVISTATQSIIDTIAVGQGPNGLSIDPTGTYLYVTDSDSGQVSVIATATDKVVDTINTGGRPSGFGNFIRPAISPVIPYRTRQ